MHTDPLQPSDGLDRLAASSGSASAHAQSSAPPEGPPDMTGPTPQSYEPVEAEQPGGPGPFLITVGVVCLCLVAFGVVRSIFASGDEPEPRPRVESIWSEQIATGQQAVDMARDVQEVQSQRRQEMEQTWTDSELGYVEDDGN